MPIIPDYLWFLSYQFDASGITQHIVLKCSAHCLMTFLSFVLFINKRACGKAYSCDRSVSSPNVYSIPSTTSWLISSINPSTYLAITKSTQLTPVQASSTYIQMSGDSGLRKENTPGLVPLGLRYRMLMPKVMKGLEKSMTFSLT